MQPYPRSPDLVWPGQLHGTGCLSARAVDTGFPTVVRRLCLGPGCGRVWVWLTPPVLAGVLGGCVWARFVVLSLFCRLIVVFVVGLGFCPAYETCVVACALRLPPAVSGSGVRCGRACWSLRFGCAPPLLGGFLGVCVGSCARPAWSPAPPCWGCCAGVHVCARTLLVPRLSWLGCGEWACVLGPGLGCAPLFLVGLSGCVFCAFFFRRVLVRLCAVGCWLSLSWALWSLPPHSLSFGLGCWLFFFFPAWCVSACFSVPFPGGPLFPAWCCRFWLGGPPVPFWGFCLRCLLGGGFGRLLWCWRAVWWLWAVLSPPPLPPLFFWGGAACSSLCPPWASARTGPHSVWSSGLLLAVAFCLAVFQRHGLGGLCTRWARRPFLPG